MLPPGQSVSQSGPGTSLVQSGPLSLPQLTLTPEMATWTSSTLSSVQSSKLCLVLLIDSTLDTGHWTLGRTEQTIKFRPSIAASIKHCCSSSSSSTGLGCRTDLIIHRSPVRPLQISSMIKYVIKTVNLPDMAQSVCSLLAH